MQLLNQSAAYSVDLAILSSCATCVGCSLTSISLRAWATCSGKELVDAAIEGYTEYGAKLEEQAPSVVSLR